ncbi:hypothetical protein BJ322DRAFT_658949 [Thelephora terrestris]|uniref:Uncharacterized protein n=1 Tax=Thelephora terrestris TaxID=56493 RepID=A0A9P6H2E4_9AGAM|nr:hypothetical protein BJ322DRAFT_658949 [Thelephora terrestris]
MRVMYKVWIRLTVCWAIISLYPLSTTSQSSSSYRFLRFFVLRFTTMFPIRPLKTGKPLAPGRSFTEPSRPTVADEPQPGSPISETSSFYEGGKRVRSRSQQSMPLHLPSSSPQAPQPYHQRIFSEPGGGYLHLQRKPGHRSDNRLIRTFSLVADRRTNQALHDHPRPRRRQAGLLHLFIIVQGRRFTPKSLRTCHSQTCIRPQQLQLQRLVCPPPLLPPLV